MSDRTLIYGCLGVSTALLLLMYLLRRGQSVQLFTGGFLALFSLGPVVNYATGAAIYSGTREEYIGRAAVGFTVALAALALSQAVPRGHQPEHDAEKRLASVGMVRVYPLYHPAFVCLIIYGAFGVVTLVPHFLAGSKGLSLLASGPGHYIYLLIELAAVSTFFMVRTDPTGRRLWVVNALTYVAYCLVTFERDFLFVFFSVLLHHQILHKNRKRPVRLVLVGLSAAGIATILVAQRGGSNVDLAGLLNQGSVLFVDTFVMSLVPVHVAFAMGSTYGDALLSLVPSWVHDSGHETLSQWLISLYAPGSTSGYGFSLTGEAYLNFGYYGIFAVFLIAGSIQRRLARNFARSDWSAYVSVYYTAVLMYAIRGDSEQMLKSVLYGGLFYAALTCVKTMRGAEQHHPVLQV